MSLFPITAGGMFLLAAVMWWKLDFPENRPTAEACVRPFKIEWRDWEPGSFEKAREEGKVVWLNFTCDWDAMTVVNHQRLFGSQAVVDKLAEHDVILIRADFDFKNPLVGKELEKYGRVTIPTDVLAPADPAADVIMLPELISPKIAIKALDQAAASGK